MKFSIITVCYNSEKTIRRTFESVLSQSFTDYEYIVVDGNSKDSTVEIIKEYEPKFNGRMHWISEPDNGIYDAMNKGIRMAKGDFINMMNSDDQIAPNALQYVVERLNEVPDTDIFNGLEKRINAFDEEVSVFRNPHRFLPLGVEIRHQSAYIRRTLHEKIGLYYGEKYSLSADYEFFLRAFENNAKFTPVDRILSIFSLDGLSDKNAFKSKKQVLKILFDHGYISTFRYHFSVSIYFVGIKFLRKIIDKIQKKNITEVNHG